MWAWLWAHKPELPTGPTHPLWRVPRLYKTQKVLCFHRSPKYSKLWVPCSAVEATQIIPSPTQMILDSVVEADGRAYVLVHFDQHIETYDMTEYCTVDPVTFFPKVARQEETLRCALGLSIAD